MTEYAEAPYTSGWYDGGSDNVDDGGVRVSGGDDVYKHDDGAAT